MISLQILDVKNFMNQLLLSDTFDHFQVIEAAVTTHTAFFIDGTIQKNYYTKEELEGLNLEKHPYASWKQLKPLCFNLIKGKKTPLSLKIIFQLSIENMEKLLAQTGVPLSFHDINGLLLNVKYDGSSLSCITGTSLNLFTMDKSLEHAWDDMVRRYFLKKEITFA